MNLRLAPPRRNTRTSVRFDGCTMSSWIFEIRLRVCNESDEELWREKRRKLSPRHVCGCSMHALRVPSHVFLVSFSLFLRRDSQNLSTILWLETHTGCRDIGNHDCRATQDKYIRL